MLYPLRFAPIFRQYLWGGRRLGEVLQKPIGNADDYAEAWEIVDRGEDQTRVQGGPLDGRTLHEVLKSHGHELLGQHHPRSQFPLLLKFLDCRRTLSVQVHPNDAQGALLDPPDLGKTEAWFVLDAQPGSLIYSGLKSGVDAATLREHLEQGTVEEILHAFTPRAGDCLFIPAGVVHALGSGLLVAEIQQASDTTFRLFDWNRVGNDGQPRPLHIEEALEVIDFQRGPVMPQASEVVKSFSPGLQVERLVECDKFVLERWRGNVNEAKGHTATVRIPPVDYCRIISVLAGSVEFSGDPVAGGWEKAQSGIMPASLPETEMTLHGACELLCAYLPPR